MSDFVPGDVFHEQVRKVYDGPLGWAVNKEDARMARVLYLAPHENFAETGDRRGHGNDFAKWIFSEEAGSGAARDSGWAPVPPCGGLFGP